MKGSPFTRLCQSLDTLRAPSRADLHTHTTFSDGTHTPASLVQRAVQAGLAAVAVTDHDTMAGVGPARQFAPPALEVIAGVEITAEYRGGELHLLGYFVDPSDPDLSAALRDLRDARRTRALEMARRLNGLGALIEADAMDPSPDVAIGRRHLGRLLVAGGYAKSLHGAFTHWLARPELADVPRTRLPVADAIALVRGAGGVASWAHPATVDADAMRELKALGLRAVECVYPWPRRAHGDRLRQMATAFGLTVTGGSDSHDPGPAGRAVGAKAISASELNALRKFTRETIPV